MKTVIEMAREAANGRIAKNDAETESLIGLDEVTRFAELVRADERNSWPAEMEAMEQQVNILTDALTMTDVIDFAKAKKEREPHIAGALFCMGCNHEWTAVWEMGTTEFECPECKSMRGRNKFDVMPSPDAQSWTCVACGNQLFHLLRDRVHCPGCGKQWGYEELYP